MKKTTPAITLKKISPKDEIEFLRAARASRLSHQAWVKVPLTTGAFKRYVNEMRLEANIQPENTASKKLAKACGFRKEGYSPKFLKKGGRWSDHERWALLNPND